MSTTQKQPAKSASIEDILDLQFNFGLAFRKLPEARVKAILKNKKLLQQLVRKVAMDLQLPFQTERAIVTIPLLEDYYKKVFGLDIPEIAEMEFPEHATLQTFMAVLPKHDEDQIMEAQQKYFHKKDSIIQAISDDDYINLYPHKNPVAKNINREEEVKIQKRPSALYVFAHSGQDEPDTNHRNKSYNDAVAEKITFANTREYLLMTGFHKFTKGYFMDKKGWTRTSSLWVDGNLVHGYWDDTNSKLFLANGNRDFRNADDGPRELFFTL